jgi:hypothetical protein
MSFIKLYFGNNAINTTELGEIMPIYDIEQISHTSSYDLGINRP